MVLKLVRYSPRIISQIRFESSIPKKYVETLETSLSTIRQTDSSEIEGTQLPHVIEPFHHKNSYRVTDSKGLALLYETLDSRMEILARVKPNDECFIFPYNHRRFTFSELKQQVDEFAQNLLNLGFQKGDRLAIMLPDIPEINIAILACASIGVIAVLLNPAYQLVETEYMLKKTKAKGLIILESVKNYRHYQIISRICPEIEHRIKGGLIAKSLPDLRHVIVANLSGKYETIVDTRYKGSWSFGELSTFNLTPLPKPIVQPEDPFVLLFTSGTTGIPKAATVSQFSLQNTINLGSALHGSYQSSRNLCSPVPIFHTFGLVLGCISPLILANKVVIPSYRKDTLATLKAIEKEKCTAINGAPFIYSSLLSHPKRKDHDLSSLEIALIGASSAHSKFVRLIKDELKVKSVIIGYGMTETASSGTMTKVTDVEENEKHAYESIGIPFPYTECKVCDTKTGLVVPHDVDGELYMRGYHIMKEYWDEPQRTAEAIDKNGWFKTGDIVSMDKDGYLYYKSRAQEVVTKNGVSIYPSDIERFLIMHDAIANIYAFGYPDEYSGEELCAWIKLKEGVKDVTANDILEYCKDKIAVFKIPKYVKFVDEFPINATGKAQKSEMRTQMLHDLHNMPVDNLWKIN
ncbi:unnamed protein product [Brachionus calyciflorus]|uniref:Medium-chain acyl-CoA ligase ACSF2, mitochondrial n=1 Tax=Brachionus calyciflorus TaxID=104777 RepID=A0A813MDF8_9BILA|nr:unnamed protein product [Brachionus calyciflorus]